MKINIELEVENIKVDEKYFNFDYKIKTNWVVKMKENYSSTYSWYSSREDFKKVLLKWRAYQCILDECEIKDFI